MNTATHRTEVVADPTLPTIRIVRDFDAPRSQVYRAWVDPALVEQWLGPKDTPTRIEHWEARTGGSWRYASWRDGEKIASFYGSFHEIRPERRLVQTFTPDAVPDGVSLDTATFEDLGTGRTRVTIVSLVESLQARDAILASGMTKGGIEGFERLDDLLSPS